MKNAFALLIVCALSGCANHPLDCAIGVIAWEDCLPGTKGYEVRQKSLANLAYAKAAKDEHDDEQCKSYGAVPGTDAYVNCRVQLSKSR